MGRRIRVILDFEGRANRAQISYVTECSCTVWMQEMTQRERYKTTPKIWLEPLGKQLHHLVRWEVLGWHLIEERMKTPLGMCYLWDSGEDSPYLVFHQRWELEQEEDSIWSWPVTTGPVSSTQTGYLCCPDLLLWTVRMVPGHFPRPWPGNSFSHSLSWLNHHQRHPFSPQGPLLTFYFLLVYF